MWGINSIVAFKYRIDHARWDRARKLTLYHAFDILNFGRSVLHPFFNYGTTNRDCIDSAIAGTPPGWYFRKMGDEWR